MKKAKKIRSLFQSAFYPALVVLALSMHLSLTGKIHDDMLSLVIAVTIIGIVALTEWKFPYKPEWNVNKGDFASDFMQTNFIFPVLTRVVLTATVIALLPLSMALEKRIGFRLWPTQMPLLLQLLLALLISEFFFYWIHRIAHFQKHLWSLHAVHHGASRVYWVNSARFHPLDATVQLIVYLAPLAVLGVPKPVIALFLTTNLVTGLLEHANIDFRAGVLNYFFNSAELHRWHHAAELAAETKNFGKVLCVWDLAFGTHYYHPRKKIGAIGLGKKAAPVPPELVPQLMYPFVNSGK